MAQLTLSFLGTNQITRDQQPITNFSSVNSQGLLVYLALQPGKPFPREVLTALFWPDKSDKNARNNLRQSLFQLRKLLGDVAEPEHPFLLVTRQTVQFNPDSDCSLDVHQFLQAIEENDLETAVSHYAGDLLPGFTCDSLEFEEWLRQERETLHHLALETMVEAARDCLRDGRLDEAQSIARQQLSLEPWREQAHRQLMQGFALAGDRGNALAQFENCREVLAEELGIEPAEETVKLFEDIKAGRYSSIGSTETILPPVKARHNLPVDTTPLIGRELERTRIGQLLTQDNERLVTIIGPGGMGKTRLALAVGADLVERYLDGVYFVDLAPLNQAEEIDQAIADALNYQAPDKTQALFTQLLKTISRQNLLLILDNFEHLLAGTTFVNEILQACSDVSILVTSRQRLNLVSESRYELGGLDFPDRLMPENALDHTAMQLFVANARRAQPDFSLNEENVTDVIRICQLVQGMPLGLVLAASWLELLSPAEIATEIEKSLDFLAAELADLPARQHSIAAVFDYSWQMLNPAEQAVLAKLSVFRGGFTRKAAEEVAGSNLRLLLSLVNKSLLQRKADSSRYNIHELLRQFAAQKLREVDPTDEAALAHCRYFARLMAREVRRQMFYFPVYIPQQYASDRDNVRRAWDYALDHGLVSELSSLVRVITFFNNTHGIKAGRFLEQARKTLQALGVMGTDPAMLHLRLAELAALRGADDPERVKQELLAFVPVLEKNRQLELLFWTYYQLSLVGMDILSGRRELLEWNEKIRNIALQMGDELFIMGSKVGQQWVRKMNGLELHIDQLEALRPCFEPDHVDNVGYFVLLEVLSNCYAASEMYEQALYYAKLRQNIAIQWRNQFFIGGAFHDLAEIYLKMGRQNEARNAVWESIAWHLAISQIWQTLGELWSNATQFPQLMGTRLAVQTLSMVYHHPEVTAYHQKLVKETTVQFEAEMGAKVFVAAWEKGQKMDFETAVSLVRSALNSDETKHAWRDDPGRGQV